MTHSGAQVKPRPLWLKILVAYLAFSALLVIPGYFAGHKEADDETLVETFSELEIVTFGESGIGIAHVCNEEWTHLYDPTLGRVEATPAVLADLSLGFQGSQYLSLGYHRDLVMGLLGGAAGGVSITRLLQSKRVRSIADNRFVAAALAVAAGVGSGYFVGHRIGYEERSSCDHPEKLKGLAEQSFWSDVDSIFVKVWLYEHNIRSQRISRKHTMEQLGAAYICPSAEVESARLLLDDRVRAKRGLESNLRTLLRTASYLEGWDLEREKQPDLEKNAFARCIADIHEAILDVTVQGHIWIPGTDELQVIDYDDPMPLGDSCNQLNPAKTSLQPDEWKDFERSEWFSQACELQRL